jgi:hypothetical protein
VHALRFGLVSCSNYTGGYFGAYRALAARDDLDFVLHVGDYIYEYGNGADRYGPAALIGVRDSQPPTETIDLQGYRLRHALHKADPDLRAAHRNHPWITIFDDHEVANNAWATGAEDHTPATESAFATRRRQAYEAYLEWMPFRLPDQHSVPHAGTRFFKIFTFGRLGDLSVLETRQNRSEYEAVRSSVPAGSPAAPSVATTQGLTGAVTATNPWIKYLDGIGHGYAQIDVTPQRVQADFHLTPIPTDALPDPRVSATVEPSFRCSWQTRAGSRRVSAATGPVGPRADHPSTRD